MSEKSEETISLFLRDERTGRHVFNAKALQVLGIDPAGVLERGFPISQQYENLPVATKQCDKTKSMVWN